jgi:hypothetical protein
VPNDTFDGKPLRFSRLADGVFIYSAGRDNGGEIAKARSKNAIGDLGFRLWDLPLRHRSVKPGS